MRNFKSLGRLNNHNDVDVDDNNAGGGYYPTEWIGIGIGQ